MEHLYGPELRGYLLIITPLDKNMTILASLAQSGLERVAFNLVVVGSTPTGGSD